MAWYYLDQTEKIGPVDDAEFGKLILNGKVTPETLVWKEGFAAWLPYGQVSMIIGNAGFDIEQTMRIVQPEEQELDEFVESLETVTCVVSGKVFPKTQAVQLSGQWVAQEYQEQFLQQQQPAPKSGKSPWFGAALLAKLTKFFK